MTDHARRGKIWEAMLLDQHREYKRQRLGSVEKMNPPILMLGTPRGGVFRARFAAEAPCDFGGAVLNGRGMRVPVLFDAKEAHGERWPFSDLPIHQGRDLECFMQFGEAFVLLRWNDNRSILLPWPRLRELYNPWRMSEGRAARGTASLSQDESRAMGLQFDEADWLSVLP